MFLNAGVFYTMWSASFLTRAFIAVSRTCLLRLNRQLGPQSARSTSCCQLSACSLRVGVSRWSLQVDPCERLSELSFGVRLGCGLRSTLRNSRCQGIPRLNRTRSVWLYYPPSFGSVERSNILIQPPSQRTCRQGRVLCVGGDGCMLFVLPIVGWLVKVSLVVE